jgi:hypothetical protein
VGRGRSPILCRFSIASSLRRFDKSPTDLDAVIARAVSAGTRRARAPVERRASPQYIIYQQNADIVNLETLAGRVGATWISNVRKEIAQGEAKRP